MKALRLMVAFLASAFLAVMIAGLLHIQFWKSHDTLAIAIGAAIGVCAFVSVMRSGKTP